MSDLALVGRVRRRLAAEGGAVSAAVRGEAAVLADDTVLASLERGVEAELSGAGPLEPLLANFDPPTSNFLHTQCKHPQALSDRRYVRLSSQ